MTPPLLGPFDYFSVQWAYTPIFDAETPEEEDCRVGTDVSRERK